MPNWLAHVLFAYVLCKVSGIRFKFNNENTAIVMVGSLIPDVVKIGMSFDFVRYRRMGFYCPTAYSCWLSACCGFDFSAVL